MYVLISINNAYEQTFVGHKHNGIETNFFYAMPKPRN